MSLVLTQSQRAAAFLYPLMATDVEEFWALSLDPGMRLISQRCLFRGTVDSCLFHPRDVFRFACLSNASALLVAHNHPSGDVRPSWQDTEVTKQLLRAGEIMGVQVVDHLILAKHQYFSFAEWGLMKVRWGRRERDTIESLMVDPNVGLARPDPTPPAAHAEPIRVCLSDERQ